MTLAEIDNALTPLDERGGAVDVEAGLAWLKLTPKEKLLRGL
jgi:hypothetical protein